MSTAPVLSLQHPTEAAMWHAARTLVEQYAASLGIDLAFQNFAYEIASLSEEYGPPHGSFVLAHRGADYVGCGGVRRHTRDDCEMKRLYVVPSQRGSGIAAQMARMLIADARTLGYRAMLLDTLPSMTSAHRLYASLGFVQIEPYRYNPVPGTTFWRLAL